MSFSCYILVTIALNRLGNTFVQLNGANPGIEFIDKHLEVVQGIRRLAASLKEISHVNEILTMHMGPDFILVNVSVDFVDPILADEIETTVDRLDKTIKQAYPLVKRVFVEAERWCAKAPDMQAGLGI